MLYKAGIKSWEGVALTGSRKKGKFLLLFHYYSCSYFQSRWSTNHIFRQKRGNQSKVRIRKSKWYSITWSQTSPRRLKDTRAQEDKPSKKKVGGMLASPSAKRGTKKEKWTFSIVSCIYLMFQTFLLRKRVGRLPVRVGWSQAGHLKRREQAGNWGSGECKRSRRQVSDKEKDPYAVRGLNKVAQVFFIPSQHSANRGNSRW